MRVGPRRAPDRRSSSLRILLQQLVVEEGLDHVVVGSLAKPANAVAVAATAAQGDNRQGRVERWRRPARRSDLADHVEAGRVGKSDVDQQHVGRPVAAEPQRVLGRPGRERLEAIGLEVHAEELAGDRIVLADDDGRELVDGGQHLRSR